MVLLRGGPHGEEVYVQLVELYTTVLDAHGDPVADLDAPDFAVYDEGERQALHGFRKLEEIPVHLADVQEYARRAGVAIYSVALGTDRRLRPLRRLARETGGRSYTLRASELPGVYEEIERELRAQYLLTYQAPEAPAGARETFRRVEVRVARPGIEARTLAGYYPE